MEMFMYFWLNYSVTNNHIKSCIISNVDYIFSNAGEFLKSDKLRLILLSGATLLDDKEYLRSLKSSAELIVCMQMRNFCIYFDIKNIFNVKKIFYPVNIDYFRWYSYIAAAFWQTSVI